MYTSAGKHCRNVYGNLKKIVKYGRSQTDYNAPTLADKVVKQPGKYTAPGNDELAAEIIQTVADSGV